LGSDSLDILLGTIRQTINFGVRQHWRQRQNICKYIRLIYFNVVECRGQHSLLQMIWNLLCSRTQFRSSRLSYHFSCSILYNLHYSDHNAPNIHIDTYRPDESCHANYPTIEAGRECLTICLFFDDREFPTVEHFTNAILWAISTSIGMSPLGIPMSVLRIRQTNAAYFQMWLVHPRHENLLQFWERLFHCRRQNPVLHLLQVWITPFPHSQFLRISLSHPCHFSHLCALMLILYYLAQSKAHPM